MDPLDSISPGPSPSPRASSSKTPKSRSRTPAANGIERESFEETIKRRKLDIDGTDDKKFKALSKSFETFCAVSDISEDDSGGVQKLNSAYRNMKNQLHQIEYNLRRNHQAIACTEQTPPIYNQMSTLIHLETDNARAIIQSSSNVIREAEKETNEYVTVKAMKTLTQKLPSTQAAEAKIREHQLDLENLQKKHKKVTTALQKQVRALSQLRSAVITLNELAHEATEDRNK